MKVMSKKGEGGSIKERISSQRWADPEEKRDGSRRPIHKLMYPLLFMHEKGHDFIFLFVGVYLKSYKGKRTPTTKNLSLEEVHCILCV